MRPIKLLLALLFSGIGAVSSAQTNQIIIHTDKIIKTISPLLTGACMEDVNHEVYGGIYSQMIFGESFQEGPMKIEPGANVNFEGLSGSVSCIAKKTDRLKGPEIRSWQPYRKGNATGVFGIDSSAHFVGKQSQQIEFLKGTGSVGLNNMGLNRQGLNLNGQKLYEGNVCVKGDKSTNLYINLENEDGTIVYAQTRVTLTNKGWSKYNFTLTPSQSANRARLSISLKKPGSVTLGYVYLQPGKWGRYMNLPVRKDVVDGLLKEHIKVLRYGGCMTNADDYLWKHMTGPREKRQPYKGYWYPYSSNGWGIIDFMNLCEAIGITGITDFHSGETPQDMADFVEYENGGINTFWGKKRAADGHPAPYHLKYLELGNEQFHDAELSAKFKLLANAIWSKDPEIQVVFCMSYDTRGDVKNNLAYFKQTIDNALAHGHRAWFDVHIWNDNEKEPNLSDLEFAQKQFLSVASKDDFKLCIFEENAGNARIKRGLAHANAINRVERLPFDIPIMCAANCLQVDGQNDNDWDQGLLFFNPAKVWGQPSYYVSRMADQNYLPLVVKADSVNGLDITALRNSDGKTIVLKVVNATSKAIDAKIVLAGYKPLLKTALVTELRGNSLDDMNTADNPTSIVPVKTTINFAGRNGEYSFMGYSFTILRFEP